MRRLLFLIPIFMLLPFLAGADSSGHYLAKVYESETAKEPSFLFEDTYTETPAGRISKSHFTDKSGKPLVEEEFYYDKNGLTRYVYKQHQTNELGEATIESGKVHYSFSEDGNAKTDTDDLEPNTITADTVASHIQKNWSAIESGDSIKVRFLLLERLDTFGFKFFKDEERDYHGTPAVDVTMKPSSIFIAVLVPHIRLTFEKAAPHRLLESFGRLPIRISDIPNPQKRSDLHAFNGLMVFEYPQK